MPVGGGVQPLPGRLPVLRREETAVDGIGDVSDADAAQEPAPLCLPGEPLAAGDEPDVAVTEHFLLAFPHLCRQVVRTAAAGQQRTVSASVLVAAAAMGIMADAGSRPEVVHRPHDRLSRAQDFADVLQREHALVDPGEMYDVGLLELAAS